MFTKLRLVSALCLLSSALFAGDIDAGAKAALESLSGAWQAESVAGIQKWFPGGDAKVTLNLDAQANGAYSTKQAAGVLKAYFGRVSVTKVELTRNGYSGGGDHYSATYNYEWQNQNGQKQSGLLNISVAKQGAQWVLLAVRVN